MVKYDCRIHVSGISYLHPYPVYTDTYRGIALLLKNCTRSFPGYHPFSKHSGFKVVFLHGVVLSRLVLECYRDGETKRRMDVRLAKSCRKTICCRSLKQPGVRCRLPQRLYDCAVGAFFHERALGVRSHADEIVSVGKAARVRTLHGFACAALSLGRARERQFARELTHCSSGPKHPLYICR